MILPPTMFGAPRHGFSGKGPGQVLLEKYFELTFRIQIYEILCLLEPTLG